METSVLTVSGLNFYIKSKFDEDTNLNNVFIEGEISNFKHHFASGHLYFSLKDEKSAVKCVMFRTAAARLKFIPEDAQKVIIRGRVAVYERDGQYQIYVEDMQPTGAGILALQFERIKKQLTAEGLFDQSRKRPIPKNVKRIAVITSEIGAAVKDIISVLGRRNPLTEVVLCPATVQGETAAQSMINVLSDVYKLHGIDLIIIGRGGGSQEDLFCFNDEMLIRTLAKSPFPVISAVGHETDFTLCDFVADLRAPTPSAAAELAVREFAVNLDKISDYFVRLKQSVDTKLQNLSLQTDYLLSSSRFFEPDRIIGNKIIYFESLISRFSAVSRKYYDDISSSLNDKMAKLSVLNPLSVMLRGYSIITKNGKAITSVSSIASGEKVKINLSDGTAEANIISVENKEI